MFWRQSFKNLDNTWLRMKAELPHELLRKAIQFAKDKTGVHRPVKEHTILIEAFEECFKTMTELGMVKEEFQSEKRES